MKVLTPEGYTFITKIQEIILTKFKEVLIFFQSNSIKSSSTLFAGEALNLR